MFSDEALRLAAANSLAAFTETAERDYDPELPWEPSETFLRKLRRLTRRADHPVIYHTMRTAAAVFLAILTMATAWLSTDQRAQAVFVAWARNLYENSVIYDFFGPTKQEKLPEYGFSTAPEGYELVSYDNSGSMGVKLYSDGNGGEIALSWYAVSDNIVSGLAFSDKGYTHETIDFLQYRADYYAPKDGAGTNELVWIDERTGICFQLSAFLEREELIQLAEAVSVQ